ncbi:MAG: SLOG family protein [Pseudoflavonifractor sp.]
MNRETTCCFTGHRPDKLPWRDDEQDLRCLDLKSRIDAALEDAYQRGMRHFICGMAIGADFYFCEAALALRRIHPEVTVEAAIPCEEQAERWSERDRNRYFALVCACDFETMVQHHYDKACMLRRNRYMVDHSAMVIAAYDGMLGGTMYTIAYAMKQGLAVVTLDVAADG